MATPHHPMGEIPDEFGEEIHGSAKTNITLCAKDLCGWERDVFPGSQPVSLNRANLNNLRQEPYMVCEKTDGTRYLLLARPDGAFFIDRKNSVRRLPPLVFPLPDDPRGSHLNTLMDGELVVDIIEQPDGTKLRRHAFLVYDLVSVNGTVMRDFSLTARLGAATADVLLPRAKRAEEIRQRTKRDTGVTGQLPGEPFSIALKPMYELRHARHVWENVTRTLAHASDGLIFTPIALGYTPGTCAKLLKWKPDNTVDFYMGVTHVSRNAPPIYKVHAFEHGSPMRDGELCYVTDEQNAEWENGRHIQGRIVECLYDTANERWAVLRVREDKKTANDINVIHKIRRAQMDAIDIDTLAEACEAVRRRKRE